MSAESKARQVVDPSTGVCPTPLHTYSVLGVCVMMTSARPCNSEWTLEEEASLSPSSKSVGDLGSWRNWHGMTCLFCLRWPSFWKRLVEIRFNSLKIILERDFSIFPCQHLSTTIRHSLHPVYFPYSSATWSLLGCQELYVLNLFPLRSSLELNFS